MKLMLFTFQMVTLSVISLSILADTIYVHVHLKQFLNVMSDTRAFPSREGDPMSSVFPLITAVPPPIFVDHDKNFFRYFSIFA